MNQSYVKQARMNKLKWGIPYPGIISNSAQAAQISSNKALMKRLIKQWNRWCEGDFTSPVLEMKPSANIENPADVLRERQAYSRIHRES